MVVFNLYKGISRSTTLGDTYVIRVWGGGLDTRHPRGWRGAHAHGSSSMWVMVKSVMSAVVTRHWSQNFPG